MYMYVFDICISNMSIICIFNNEIDATDIECTYVYSMCVCGICVWNMYMNVKFDVYSIVCKCCRCRKYIVSKVSIYIYIYTYEDLLQWDLDGWPELPESKISF